MHGKLNRRVCPQAGIAAVTVPELGIETHTIGPPFTFRRLGVPVEFILSDLTTDD